MIRSWISRLVCLCFAASACGTNPGGDGEPPTDLAGTGTTAAVVDDSREVLLEYLGLIRNGQYDSALAMYAGDTASIPAAAWFGTDTLTASQFLRAACSGGLLQCDLQVRRVVEAHLISPDTVRLTLELESADGSRFEPSRCCDEPGAADTLFVFDVLVEDGEYRVLSLPVYRP